jgi:hypothetical protein
MIAEKLRAFGTVLARPFSRSVIVIGVTLLLVGGTLVAQGQKQVNEQTAVSSRATVTLGGTGECSPANPKLLPRLLMPVEKEEASLIHGISNWAPPPPNEKIDPDDYKSLLGYYGPYYNIKNLDGRVLVLEDTVYIWPGEPWRATGMVRNQSCDTVQITALTARLLGSDGKLLDTVTATVPVNELRPGEPAPFTINSSINGVDVGAVDWIVGYVTSGSAYREFRFENFRSNKTADGSLYSLSGSIHNVGSSSATDTFIVIAWVDGRGRLIYVGEALVQAVDHPSLTKKTVDVGQFADFLYTTKSPSLISLLGDAIPVFWGVSR